MPLIVALAQGVLCACVQEDAEKVGVLDVFAGDQMAGALSQALEAGKGKEKVIVFFAAVRLIKFAADLFRRAGHPDLMEMHSDLSQGQRTAAIARFTKASSGILFASDAVARGIDINDVTTVIQVGYTDPATYEHRVGRTGRAGRSGKGLWLLADDEESRVLQSMQKLPLKRLALDEASLQPTAALAKAVGSVMKDAELKKGAERAFISSLGFYATHQKRFGWKPSDVVAKVKERMESFGLTELPSVEAKTLAKMNLRGATGIPVAPRTSAPSNRRTRRSRASV